MWQTIESKVKNSVNLADEEAKWLFEQSAPADLERLYRLADEANERLNGSTVSFVHNMNVNYTNICEHHCTFCEYRKESGSKDAYILTFDEVKRRLEHAEGEVTEITYQGGLSPEVSFEQALGLLYKIKTAYPQLHVHAFSPEEIDYYAKQNDLSWRETLKKCWAAGMDSVCGTAAEILDDTIRRQICPEKISADEWVGIIRTAHRLGLCSTSTILFGHLEKPEHVVNHLKRIRDLQRETHGITEFIPLLFVADKTKLGRTLKNFPHLNPLPKGEGMAAKGEPRQGRGEGVNHIEYAFKMIAIARLYFMNEIRNIQVSWVKLGWENALKALSRGANDMGGTLYYENITREAGGANGEYAPKSKFISEITRIGKTPFERDTIYSFQRELVKSTE